MPGQSAVEASPPGGATRRVTFTAGAAGTLTLGCTVTADTGCSSTGSANVTVHPAFTTRNLAVLRIGDGSASLTSAGTPVFVDEYTVGGALAQSIALPANGSGALVNSGSASSEGALMRSPDGSLLCFAGYNADAGTASIASTTSAAVPRAAGTLDAGGSFALAATTSTQFSGNNIRSAATDGTNNFWAAGNTSGTYYLGNASAASPVQTTLANTRVLNTINDTLWFTVGSGTARGLYAFSGLPAGASSATQLIDTGASSSPYAFAVNAAGTLAYIADDSAVASGGGIQKWINDAGTWSLAYTLTNAGTGSRGLAVDFSGANAVMYSTTTESSTNRLVVITDTGSNAPATTLATAPPNTVFRGVAFTPESAPAMTLQPQDQSACGGSLVAFTSAAEGASTLAPQWQVSTDNGATFGNIGGATSASYSFTVVNADQGKRFRVSYSNNYGAVTSSVAMLTANSAAASDFLLNAYQGAPFEVAEADVLAYASGSGGVSLTSMDTTSANGVSLTRTNGEIYYNGGLVGGDSFHYTVTSVSGNCSATALVTVVANMNISPTLISVANDVPLLSFTVIPNFSYTVQRSTNLTAWVDLLTTNAPAGSGRFAYQDLTPPQPAAFYRLRYNP